MSIAPPFRYLSVCSGIEAASVAWHPLGWRPLAFSEIEPFPCAVLKERWPDVPNLGDMRNFHEWPEYESVDLLAGGTPCQAFSIAGLREGLADPRGNLMLTYLAIAARYRPRWLVWENVPGVLSIDGGRAFGTLLGGLAKLGYGFAYRVLDAQYVRVESHPRAVPQRRRRVFVVGYIGGDWRRAAAVLFERESLCGHNPPRREARKGVAGTLGASAPSRRNGGSNPTPSHLIDDGVAGSVTSKWAKGTGGPAGDECYNLTVAQTVTANCRKSDRGEDGNLIAFSCKDSGSDAAADVSPTVRAMNNAGGNANAGGQIAIAFGSQDESPFIEECALTITGRKGDPGMVMPRGRRRVRRLTPLECERLQGFVDNYTAIDYRGRPAKDGPRYEALGNTMAVNVMRWLGRRIDMVEGILA